jgi:hypothetical protein
MKKAIVFSKCVYGALFVALVLFCMHPGITYAHPPQNIHLEYDMFFQNLTVKITHKSAAPDQHYIKSVIIKKNGKVFSTTPYESQPDKETFTYTYKVSAKDGDVLEVTAACSVFGSKTEKISIKG